jgi:peptidoglycan hydrolase-like protein with peptidoglycan-binding domain
MRARAGLVTVLAAGALLLSACGPTIGGAGAIDTPATTAATTAATTSDAATATPSPSATEAPAPTTTAAPAPPATPAYVMTGGSTGDRVRELQARLKQLEWYDGKVTGAYDAPTTAGVRGFQGKRGMPETGSVDQATWASLTGMTRQPTKDELTNTVTAGPALLKQGSTGAKVRDLQARLKQIGWWSGDVVDAYGPSTAYAVKQFQDKRQIPATGEVDQRTLDKLNAMTRKPTNDELNNVKPTAAPVSAAGLDPRCMSGRVMCISKSTRTLTWVIDGQPQMKLAVRFGSEYTPTREGVFSVFQKNREWTSTLYGSKMPYSMFFSGGQAVHYSSDFAARGYTGASHGCVNVRDLGGIASLFGQVNLGDKVVVY